MLYATVCLDFDLCMQARARAQINYTSLVHYVNNADLLFSSFFFLIFFYIYGALILVSTWDYNNVYALASK